MFGNHPTKVQVISKTCRRALLSTAQPIVWGRVQPFQIEGWACLPRFFDDVQNAFGTAWHRGEVFNEESAWYPDGDILR